MSRKYLHLLVLALIVGSLAMGSTLLTGPVNAIGPDPKGPGPGPGPDPEPYCEPTGPCNHSYVGYQEWVDCGCCELPDGSPNIYQFQKGYQCQLLNPHSTDRDYGWVHVGDYCSPVWLC